MGLRTCPDPPRCWESQGSLVTWSVSGEQRAHPGKEWRSVGEGRASECPSGDGVGQRGPEMGQKPEGSHCKEGPFHQRPVGPGGPEGYHRELALLTGTLLSALAAQWLWSTPLFGGLTTLGRWGPKEGDSEIQPLFLGEVGKGQGQKAREGTGSGEQGPGSCMPGLPQGFFAPQSWWACLFHGTGGDSQGGPGSFLPPTLCLG